MSRSIRRILSWGAIYLGDPSPGRSSRLPGTRRAASSSLSGVAPRGACRAASVTGDAGALLPHRFTLTRPKTGGLFSVALCRRVSPPRRYLARCSVVSGRSSRSPWGPGGPLICTRHPTGGSRLSEPRRPKPDVVHLQQPVEEQTIVQQHNPHSPPGLRGLTAQRSPHSSRRAEARRRTRSAPNAWQPHAQRALRAPRSCLTGPAGSNEVVRPHSAGLNDDPGLMATTGDRLPSADGQQRDVLAPGA